MNGIETMRFAMRSTILGMLVAGWFTLAASGADLAVLRNGFSIRHEHRQVMGESTRLFLGADDSSYIDVPTAGIETFEKDWFVPPAAASLEGSPPAPDLNQLVNAASAAYHLDPDLVNSVILAESGFNAQAVSPKGAQGLMQLMPGTAWRLGVTNPFNPQANVEGGTRYLRQLLERYNFDLLKALAAYNAGPQRVEQYRGVPPYRETRAYITRVVNDYNRKKTTQEKQAAAAAAAAAVKVPSRKKVPANHSAAKAQPQHVSDPHN
jgi:soluble lytic murein transglycosylase-like protein